MKTALTDRKTSGEHTAIANRFETYIDKAVYPAELRKGLTQLYADHTKLLLKDPDFIHENSLENIAFLGDIIEILDGGYFN